MDQGELFRNNGINVVLQNTPLAYRQTCEDAIHWLAGLQQPFTAEDVRYLAGDPPHSCNSMGGIIFSAVKRGIIVQVGYTKSKRPSSHKALLQTYVGVGE